MASWRVAFFSSAYGTVAHEVISNAMRLTQRDEYFIVLRAPDQHGPRDGVSQSNPANGAFPVENYGTDAVKFREIATPHENRLRHRLEGAQEASDAGSDLYDHREIGLKSVFQQAKTAVASQFGRRRSKHEWSQGIRYCVMSRITALFSFFGPER